MSMHMLIQMKSFLRKGSDNSSRMTVLPFKLKSLPVEAEAAPPELASARGIVWSVGLGSVFWAVLLYVWLVA